MESVSDDLYEEDKKMTKKRKIALFFALVTVLSLLCTSIASAALPTAKCSKKPSTAWRGYTTQWVFKLKCGSYKKVGSYWRSEFDSYVYKKSSNVKVASKEIYFTGNLNYTLSWYVPYSTKRGSYYNKFQTWYRIGYSNLWYLNTNKKAGFKIK